MNKMEERAYNAECVTHAYGCGSQISDLLLTKTKDWLKCHTEIVKTTEGENQDRMLVFLRPAGD